MTLNNKEKLEKSENKVNKINNEFYKKQTKIKIVKYFPILCVEKKVIKNLYYKNYKNLLQYRRIGKNLYKSKSRDNLWISLLFLYSN